MARTKEYDREEVIDLATELFWRKGFKGTSVSDLTSTTGLGYRSLYQEFGSKEGLFRECIDHFNQKTIKRFTSQLTRHPLGLRNIESFLRLMTTYASSPDCPGCMMVNSSIEKELLEKEAFLQVKNILSGHEELLYLCLLAAQKNEEIPAEKDCRALASYLFTFCNGLMVRSKVGPSKDSIESMVRMTLFTIMN